jgi:hypothetical protein
MFTSSHTHKKENKIFLIYKKIQMGAVAKSYMRKVFLIYEEMLKYLFIFKEAVSLDFSTAPFWISLFIYEENLVFFFIRAPFALSDFPNIFA